MLEKYLTLLPKYINATSIGITIEVCHYYYFWNYHLLILREFPFDWRKLYIVYCIRLAHLSWNILSPSS